jgi:tetratricopeptide (TPR) repeat protein
MSSLQIDLIAFDIRKWDLERKRIWLTGYYLIGEKEETNQFDIAFRNPNEMVEESLRKIRSDYTNKLKNQNGKGDLVVTFNNESLVRQKLLAYFKKVKSETNGKQNKEQPRMIFSTHLDIYEEKQDISSLTVNLRFYVVLNWARKYYNREEFKKAVSPLRKLTRINPQFGSAYKWLARSLKKIRKYKEATKYYEKYYKVDQSLDAMLDLAKAYRKGKDFEKSEKVYLKIFRKYPDDKEARIGLAQIKYAIKDPEYVNILNSLYESDQAWLKEWLVEEFNFRIYVPDKTFLTPVQASKFLGFKQVFALTELAFKNKIPSHFNPAKARLSFFKEELENWAMVMNKFCDTDEEIKLYPENLSEEEIQKKPQESTRQNDCKDVNPIDKKEPLTRVEKILMDIRKRKQEQKRIQESFADDTMTIKQKRKK